jgi:hypothetical protein
MRETPNPDRDDQSNEIGYRNVDEEAEHDERGSQGPSPGDSEPGEDDHPGSDD